MGKKSIKYLVRCPYCDKSYTVDTKHGEDFCCPTCSGAATLKDAVKIEETPEDAKKGRKSVPVKKWIKLDRPDWYGEDKKRPTEAEEEESDYQYSTEKDGTEKSFDKFAYLVIIILAILHWIVSAR